MTEPYNPLSKVNLGKSVAEALLDREPHPLGSLPVFDGAGIYVIYYNGDHPAYGRLAEANAEAWNIPIYIGKAIPSGGRRGGRRGAKALEAAKGKFLHLRLKEHAESVQDVCNLDVANFAARWLVVDEIWIPLGETLLINQFYPVWNVLLDGFGNHDPGAGRRNGLVPKWDILHPGRDWAPKQKPRKETAADLQEKVIEYLDAQDFPDDPHMTFAPPGG